jgi:ligand-binding sensor domain-containing protein
VWVGTFNGGMAVVNDGRWSIFNSQNSLLQSNNVKSIGFDRYDNTWVCTNNGIVKINGKVWTAVNPSVTNFEFQTVYDVVCDKNIWFASDHGLMEFDGDTWKNLRVDNSDIPTNDIRAISMDENNNIWIGTAGKGIVIYNPAGIVLAVGNSINSENAINVFPNPAKGEVTFSFNTGKAGNAELDLYDMLGKKVCTVFNEEVGVGKHEVKYNINKLPAGLYIWRIKLKDRIATMMLSVI